MKMINAKFQVYLLAISLKDLQLKSKIKKKKKQKKLKNVLKKMTSKVNKLLLILISAMIV